MSPELVNQKAINQATLNQTTNLTDLLNARTPQSQARIQHMAQELFLEHQLYQLREKLEISQRELADTLNIKQPSLSAMEKRGNEIKVSSLKRYVEAMGGKMSIDVELPTGEHVAFTV